MIDIAPGWQSRRAKVHQIIDEVCRKHLLPRDRVLLPSPARGSFKSSHARHEVYWRLRHELHLSTPQVGAIVGRDHSTVVHGCQQHERREDERGPPQPQ